MLPSTRGPTTNASTGQRRGALPGVAHAASHHGPLLHPRTPSQGSWLNGVWEPAWPAPFASQRCTMPLPRAAATATVDAPATDDLGILSVDPMLKQYKDHLFYRQNTFVKLKKDITAAEGSVANFAKGYEKFGFVREGNAIVYREWAPAARAAALIGDFNGWGKDNGGAWMTKDTWGVWSVTLPDGPDGKPAIAHGSRVKIRLQHPDGWWCDRIPAWIKWATVPPNEMGARYCGIYWDPPVSERHQWKHARPQRPSSLRIYEAHVGMSGEEEKVHSYTYFKDQVLPRIKASGYTAIQLMAVQEHAYFGSFGYHVTNPFAVSSRSGTPEELKALIDEAHRLGIAVLLDLVHSHMSSNTEDGIAGFDMGQGAEANYFLQGDAGYHKLWDSRCLNYRSWECLRYLLSNVRWWLEEYKFDGFRFDGVTSMLYHHHGIGVGFSGGYHEYFGLSTNVDACVYLMLANELAHQLVPQAITIAEDVSGMPALCRPVSEGGLGFDYRLGMAIPDKWIQLLKERRDEHWGMMEIVKALCDRRYTEKTVAYCESHDQALVGDKTVAFRLMDAEMYTGMSSLTEATPVIERGIAMHKLIRAVTMVLGGEAWLCFMGNEFGHPEWIDFPRDGNGWSHKHCRRQWSLVEMEHLRYKDLGEWDRQLMALDDRWQFLASPNQWVTHIDDQRQVLVAERGPLVWVFNFSPATDYEALKVAVPEPGKYRVALDSDALCFGGKGRVGHDVDHFSEPAPDGFNNRGQFIRVLAPRRTAVAYCRMNEEERRQAEMAAAQAKAAAVAAALSQQLGGSSSSSSRPKAASPPSSKSPSDWRKMLEL